MPIGTSPENLYQSPSAEAPAFDSESNWGYIEALTEQERTVAPTETATSHDNVVELRMPGAVDQFNSAVTERVELLRQGRINSDAA